MLARLFAVVLALACLLAFAGPAQAAVPFRGAKWPGGKVTYYDATPSSYRWSVQYAVSHWNSVGAKVKFVKVKSRRSAKLVIKENRRLPVSGRAHLATAAAASGSRSSTRTWAARATSTRPRCSPCMSSAMSSGSTIRAAAAR